MRLEKREFAAKGAGSQGAGRICRSRKDDKSPQNAHCVEKANEILNQVHSVFSNFKRWAKVTFNGLRKRHVQRYLDELVLRWDHRHHQRRAFDRLLRIGVDLARANYRDLVEQRV